MFHGDWVQKWPCILTAGSGFLKNAGYDFWYAQKVTRTLRLKYMQLLYLFLGNHTIETDLSCFYVQLDALCMAPTPFP